MARRQYHDGDKHYGLGCGVIVQAVIFIAIWCFAWGLVGTIFNLVSPPPPGALPQTGLPALLALPLAFWLYKKLMNRQH
jgi:hypothetical protein